MTVRKLDNGKWEARPDGGRDADGKRVQYRRRFDTKAEAERFDARMSYGTATHSKFTVSSFWDAVYAPYIETRVRPATLQHYQSDFENHVRPVLGKVRLEDLKPWQVQREIDRCETWGAANNLYKVLRQLLRRARSLGYIETVATDGCDLPKHKREPIEVIGAEDMPTYLRAVEEYAPEIAAGVCVSMMGARRSEVCALTWDDVTFGETVEVRIERSVSFVDGERRESPTKTEKSKRRIYLPQWIGDTMRKYQGDGRVVPVEPDGYSYRWRQALKQAGLPYVSLKNLRHSVGTALADAGLSMYDIQNLLGHDLITTTSRFYLQQSDGSITRAADMMQHIVTPGDTKQPKNSPHEAS